MSRKRCWDGKKSFLFSSALARLFSVSSSTTKALSRIMTYREREAIPNRIRSSLMLPKRKQIAKSERESTTKENCMTIVFQAKKERKRNANKAIKSFVVSPLVSFYKSFK